ncbi:alpha/beta hydrolase [uncultured Maribacter sp.]|uniref:alpha/beta fold hydrolase n=1 Tax=uncultured Maribacter sp. TaxID=431308 RepID=UPI00261D245F|nr:alpha/beta hydrolase [uncultured Maribacter sp.]
MLNYTKYIHENSNTWVTFVHGAGGSSIIWHKQVREFRKHFNVLLLDLKGHGASVSSDFVEELQELYTFDTLAEDIIEVIDFEGINTSHFIGISLGTIIIRTIAEKHPERVQSMIMGGAIMKLGFKSRLILRTGMLLKKIVPYHKLYNVFIFLIMPYRNHKESRNLFIKESKKIYKEEFLKWFRLAVNLKPILHFFRSVEIKIPTLYIMGEEDYLFLPAIRKIADKHSSSNLFVVQDCGHVVNVEQPQLYNNMVIGYLSGF